MASYPGSAKTFTTKNTGDVVQASHINDLQDEVNAIETGLLTGTARLNSSNSTVANLSVTGGSTFAGGLNFVGDSTFSGALSVGGNSTIGNFAINSSGSTAVEVGLAGSGAVRFAGTGMQSNYNSTFNAALSVTGNSSMARITISSAVTGSPIAKTIYSNNLISAWAVTSSTPGLGGSFNISSVTSGSSGQFNFAFTTDLASSAYCVMATPMHAGVRVDLHIAPGTLASSGFRILASSNAGGVFDMVPMHVLVVGP